MRPKSLSNFWGAYQLYFIFVAQRRGFSPLAAVSRARCGYPCARSRTLLPIVVCLSRPYKALPMPCLTGNSSRWTIINCPFCLMRKRSSLFVRQNARSRSRLFSHKAVLCVRSRSRLPIGVHLSRTCKTLSTPCLTVSSSLKSSSKLGVQTKKEHLIGVPFLLAQRRGFEPPVRFRRTHDFQSCSLNHSDISA